MPKSDSVLCNTLYGQSIAVPRAALVFRPTVYGIAIHDDRILLLPNRLNGRWELPGGGVEPGELLPDALHREFQEETGLLVRPGKLLQFEERFFQWTEHETLPWHILVFYYHVDIADGDLRIAPYRPEPTDEPCGVPKWVPFHDINPDNLRVGYHAVMKAKEVIPSQKR